jgi:hypothetical protein
MPCLLLLIALIAPRVLVFALWLIGWFQGVFPSIMWPLLGFIFLPMTLLWYTTVAHMYHGEWGPFQFIVMVIAIAIDVSPAKRRRRET